MPPGRLSRGQQKRPLSNSYKRFGLCDSLATKRELRGSGPLKASQGTFALGTH